MAQKFQCGYINKTYTYNNNEIFSIAYTRKIGLHRDGDKPAYIRFYYANGEKMVDKSYYKEGKRHRDGDKPANIGYLESSGKKLYYYYYKNDELHREGKPAVICYTYYGNKKYDYYCNNGKIYKVKEYLKGSVDWYYIYNIYKYDIEFLVKYSKQMEEYMSREDKMEVIEYKMRKND